VTGRKNLHWSGRSVNVNSAASASPSYRRGMQPKSTDPRSLYRETVRLSWAIHCLHVERSRLVLVLDRWDQRLAKLRREHDDAATQLEHTSPELFARAEERRREMDNPRKALEWSQKGDPEGVL
jgi:hypothetical protein